MENQEQRMTSLTGSTQTLNKSFGKTGGFTLLEMIAVLALLAGIAAVAAPSLRQFFKARTIQEECRRMVAITEFGRREAISIGVPVQIIFDLDRRIIFVQREDGYASEDSKFPGPFEVDPAIDIDFGMEPPIYGRTWALTFLPDGGLTEESARSWRITQLSNPGGTPSNEDLERSYWIARMDNHLHFKIFKSDEINQQSLPQPSQGAEQGSVYLR